MTNLEKKYFDLVFTQKICTYERIDEHLDQEKGTARQKYELQGKIRAFLAEQLKISIDKVEELEKYFKRFQKLNNKYNNESRKQLFDDPKRLVNWWDVEQGNKCGYCGISQDELSQIVQQRGENLTLNGGQKRSKGSLEIEKKDPAKSYTFDNVILACPLCNNAKSNLISEEDWRRFFAVPMRKYYEHLLDDQLENDLPVETVKLQEYF